MPSFSAEYVAGSLDSGLILLHGFPHFNRSDCEWDSGEYQYAGQFDSLSDALAEVDSTFPIGDAAPDASHLHCTECDVVRDGGSVYMFTVRYKGLLGDANVKCEVSTRTEVTTISDSESPDDATENTWEVRTPVVTAKYRYVTFTEPLHDQVGKYSPAVPIEVILPSPPDNAWESLGLTTDKQVWMYPWGWVLDARETERIGNADIWLVQDTYSYYQRFKPKG